MPKLLWAAANESSHWARIVYTPKHHQRIATMGLQASIQAGTATATPPPGAGAGAGAGAVNTSLREFLAFKLGPE